MEITVRGGNGGVGCVSFLHEKYREHGGPDGGDGGRGGDVLLFANASMQSLGHLMSRREIIAANGEPGRGSCKTGADAKPETLHLPIGTQVINKKTNELFFDLNHPEMEVCIAKGGIGGRGNQHFATSTNQTPDYAQGGLPGEEFTLILKLKLLADAGLVGLPNAGKSTILAAITKNVPRIADYAFTTLTPNIGVVENNDELNYRRLLLADIPGIIEGASRGIGLGISFLRHIERVRLIIYVVDGTNLNAKAEIQMLQNELRSYSKELLKRPVLVIINKMDQFEYDTALAQESVASLMDQSLWSESGDKLPEFFYISAKEKKGIQSLIESMFKYFPEKTLAEISIDKDGIVAEQKLDDEPASFVHITH